MQTVLSFTQRLSFAVRLWRGPWTGPMCVTLLVLTVIFAASPNFRFADAPDASPYAGDFLQEWVGGRIFREGDYSRFYDPDYAHEMEHDARLIGFRWNEQRYLPIVYPPFYYAIVSPLSRLPLPVAAWVWAALMVVCLIVSAWVLITHARKHSRQRVSPWLLPAALFFMPLIENFTSSQKGSVCLLILSITFVLLDRKQPYWAGLVFGLLAFKPQLTLVIAFAMLFKGQWRFVMGGVTTGLLLIGVSLAMGLDVCGQYVAFSAGAADYLQTSGYDLTKSHCLYGTLTLLNGGKATLPVKCATVAAVLVVASLLAVALRHGLQPGTPRFRQQFSALVISTVLVSQHLFTYDLTILLLPMFQLIQGTSDVTVHTERRPAVAWLLAAIFSLSGVAPIIASQTGIQITTILLLALCVTIVNEVRRCQIRSSGLESRSEAIQQFDKLLPKSEIPC